MNVGVLARPTVVEWQRQALENIDELDGVDIVHTVVDSSLRQGGRTMSVGADVINERDSVSLDDLRLFFRTLREEGLKSVVYADQKLGWVVFGEDEQLRYLQSKPVEDVDCLGDAAFHDCEPVSADGAWNTLPDDVTERLGADCDVVVRFGFGLLKGDILTAPEYGVISSHGSDIRTYRGMGPRITFLNGDRTADVTLQRLTEDIDGGKIITVSSRRLPDRPTIDEVFGRIYDLKTRIFAEGVDRLRQPDFEYTEPESLGEYYAHSRLEKSPVFAGRVVLKNNLHRLRRIGASPR